MALFICLCLNGDGDMCQAKPGVRCSAHMKKKLNRLQEWKVRNPNSPNIDKKIDVAKEDYFSSLSGIRELFRAGEVEKAQANLRKYEELLHSVKRAEDDSRGEAA